MNPEDIINEFTFGDSVFAQNMRTLLAYCEYSSREQIARRAAEAREESVNFLRHSAINMHVLQREAEFMEAYLASIGDDQ